MYCILKKSGTSSDNLWMYYAVNGVLFTTDDLNVAADKMEELAETTPFGDLRLIQNVDTEMEVIPTEPEPEPAP